MNDPAIAFAIDFRVFCAAYRYFLHAIKSFNQFNSIIV